MRVMLIVLLLAGFGAQACADQLGNAADGLAYARAHCAECHGVETGRDDFSPNVDRRCLTPESAALAVETEDRAALIDSLILCKFLRGVFGDLFAEAAEMLRLVTGWDVSGEELRATSRRIVAAKKLFNSRAGWQPSEDVLPKRFLSRALSDDPAAHLSREQLAAAVQAYNLHRGWTAEGWLPCELLAELDYSAASAKTASTETLNPGSVADVATSPGTKSPCTR